MMVTEGCSAADVVLSSIVPTVIANLSHRISFFSLSLADTERDSVIVNVFKWQIDIPAFVYINNGDETAPDMTHVISYIPAARINLLLNRTAHTDTISTDFKPNFENEAQKEGKVA